MGKELELTNKGVEFDGKIYLSRLEVRHLFHLSNNKNQRIFEGCELPYIIRYNRHLYEAEQIINYFKTAVNIDRRKN